MALELRGVSKSFGHRTAVKDISFEVEKGQVFGLLGLNGAGKSTTIRMILDIIQPDTGTVLWHGQPVQGTRHQFGYLPEERGLYPRMRVRDQLVWYGRLNGMAKAEADVAAKRWLDVFEIADAGPRTVGDLSKGNQQKVQFIMAVLHSPELLILDEPFSGLDPVNTTLFKQVFQEIADSGTTILFSSHRMDHVEELSDAVAIIHDAGIAACGRVHALLANEQPRSLRIGGDLTEILPKLPTGCGVTEHRGMLEVSLSQVDANELLTALVHDAIFVSHFELVRPSLEDLFLQKVGRNA